MNAHMSRKHPVIEQLDGNSSLISLQDRTLKCYFCDFTVVMTHCMCEDESNLRQMETVLQHLRQFANSSKSAEDQDELKRKLSMVVKPKK